MADLDGTGVLITRPAHQSDRLAALVEERGGRAFRLPAIGIEPQPDSAALRAALDALPRCRIAIFVSANAAEHGMAAVHRRFATLPAGIKVAAVGRASARVLEAAGVAVDILPAGPGDSEGLLAHPALSDVAGEVVVIFRGVGGRGLLARTLRERGARVLAAPCYRRVRSASDPSAVLAQWRAGAIDIAVVTSVESLHALADLLGDEGRALMRATPAVVMSRRVAEAARGTVSEALVAEDMSDAGIVEAIARWRLRTADRPPPT